MDHDVHFELQSAYLFVVSVVLSHSILLVGRVFEERNSGHKQQNCGVKDEKMFFWGDACKIQDDASSGGTQGWLDWWVVGWVVGRH